jgi:uncharacterized damage-inducible protein DinB
VFRRLADFEKIWAQESASTLRLLEACSDAALEQSVSPDGRTLRRLAWHLTLAVGEMMRRTGLELAGPARDAAPPARLAPIVAAYRMVAESLDEQIRLDWSDQSLDSEDEMYGERWKRGFTLFALLLHQAHHRGQMTVLMRQAGLPVPGLLGPAREEWAALGFAAPPP